MKFLINFLSAALILIPTEVFAAEYETPHKFSAGDTISADMMNEIFDYIKNAQQMISSSDLVGTWSCTLYSNNSSSCNGWTSGIDSLYYYKTGTITFSDDGDGTFSYTTADINLFICGDNSAGSGKWFLKNNVLFVDISDGGTTGVRNSSIRLKRISNSKLLLENMIQSAPLATFSECDNQNLPPTTPETFTASASGKTVNLAWSDNSADETGFKVLRKDILTGSYSIITTTSADATSYSDTVTTDNSSGQSYWYRVSATNSNGDSIGSKVVKVDVK